MTVLELITLLAKMPPRAQVIVDGYEGDYDFAQTPELVRVKRKREQCSYMGALEMHERGSRAVLLRR